MVIKRLIFAAGKKDRSWFWWGINIGVLIAIGVWWWLDRQSKASVTVKVQPLVLPPDEEDLEVAGEQDAASRVVEARVEEPDDLQMIEGIGPRSAQALLEAGILTFKVLAAMDADAIHGVLRAAGVRVPYPETWPEQATLAAAGKWDALKELQGHLKGGRRV